MKLITYIRYFYFLLDNWDFKIAWYMIKQEIKGKRKNRNKTRRGSEIKKKKNLKCEKSIRRLTNV